MNQGFTLLSDGMGYGQAWRIWKSRLNYPIFIPKELSALKTILDEHGREAFATELQRHARLGSVDAVAIQAYIQLRGAFGGLADAVEAVRLCSATSRTSEYLDYVWAWAYASQTDYANALKCLQRSGQKLFPPAALDLALFVWQGWGVKEPDPKVALWFVGHAAALGHYFAPVLRSAFYRSGRLGIARKIISYLLYPLVLLRYGIAMGLNPFDARVFTINLRARRPLFSS